MKADTGKVIRKKKTTFQKVTGTTNIHPVFNETIVFDMPPAELIHTVLLVLVCLTDKPPGMKSHCAYDDTDQRTANQSSSSSYQAHPRLNSGALDDPLLHDYSNLNPKAKRMNSNGSSHGSADSHGSSSMAEGRRSSEPMTFVSNPQGPNTYNSSNKVSVSTEEKPHRTKDSVVGKVALGYCVRNPMGKYHWENMMRTPRNVVTEWHGLK